MSTAADPDGNGTHQSNVTAVDNLLKRNSDDVGWEYGTLVDAPNKDKVKCKICGHESSGGVHRLKEHVAGVGKNVKKCRSMTDEAKEKCHKSLDESKRKRKEKTVRELELREEVNVHGLKNRKLNKLVLAAHSLTNWDPLISGHGLLILKQPNLNL
jgi:Sec-independent protein translocase protein TatA